MSVLDDNTYWGKDKLESLLQAAADARIDAQRDHRRAIHECPACFYIGYTRGRLAGSAFTKFTCKRCGKDDMHSNTAVPMLCRKCCEENNLCCRCEGGNFDVTLCEFEGCLRFQYVMVKKKKLCGIHASAPEYKRCRHYYLKGE